MKPLRRMIVIERWGREGTTARPITRDDFRVKASAADVTPPTTAVSEVREHLEEQP